LGIKNVVYLHPLKTADRYFLRLFFLSYTKFIEILKLTAYMDLDGNVRVYIEN